MIFTPTEKEVIEAAKEVAKTKQKRPQRSENYKTHEEPGDNTKYIGHSMELMSLGKCDMSNPQLVQKRIYDYFSICEKNDMKPSVESLALAFGTNRKQLWKWVNGIECNYIPVEARQSIEQAYAVLNAMMADYMQNGKINPVSGIFLMKNNMNYADQTEVVITPNNPLGAETSAEEVQKRIAAGVVIDVPEDE